MQFLTNGLQPSFQDLGRFGQQALGINPDGAMDVYALRLLNVLLENQPSEGVLEMHFPAPQLLFEEDTCICIGGADFGAMLDDEPLELYKTTNVGIGSRLKFTKKITGERAYLGVKNGFLLNEWLDSISFNTATKLPPPLIKKGLSISLKKPTIISKEVWMNPSSKEPSPLGGGQGEGVTLRFVTGNQFECLTENSQRNLLTTSFSITNEANRMGYRLLGEPLALKKQVNGLSSAVTFGTMQLLPSGQLIVLMASHQTTGGYPLIGNVIAVDLPKLAQSSVNDSLQFQAVTIEIAEQLFLEREQSLCQLAIAVNLKNS